MKTAVWQEISVNFLTNHSNVTLETLKHQKENPMKTIVRKSYAVKCGAITVGC